jgi:diguanylate cyclase (GGDEF)-like protein
MGTARRSRRGLAGPVIEVSVGKLCASAKQSFGCKDVSWSDAVHDFRLCFDQRELVMSEEQASEGDSVRWAKRGLGGDRGRTDGAPANEDTEGQASAGASPGESATAGSVESMLQEFSSGGTDAQSTGGAPRAGKYDQLWQLSMADPHTGLANQLLLLDRLTQALVRRKRHGGEVVACHVDLDNLAEINLDLGYTTGNEVLREMSRRLTSVLRTEDTIGRVGGSELVVVVTVNDEQAVGPLLRRLQHTLDEPVTVGTQAIRLHASLGVAIAEDAESAEDVLTRADRSTRVSKR